MVKSRLRPIAFVNADVLKMCFFVFPKNCEGLFQNVPRPKNVVEYTCMTNMHVPAWTTAKGNVAMFLP